MNAKNSKSRIAIVTGAARGIGCEIASRLRSRDLHVCSLDVESCPIEGVLSLIVDLRNHNDVRKCLDDVRSSLGAPEFLVNNAALAGRAAEMGLPDTGATQHFHELTEVNLVAPFLLMEIFARDVISGGHGGRVVNLASAAAHRGGLRSAGYSAVKAGLVGLSRAAAVDLAPHNIQVNSISPGYVATKAALAEYPLSPQELIALNPLGRTGTPDEIARLVEYLLLDAPAFITGADIRIDGGATIM